MLCDRCAGACYVEQDHYGTFLTCWRCGRSVTLKIDVQPDLWALAEAASTPAPISINISSENSIMFGGHIQGKHFG